MKTDLGNLPYWKGIWLTCCGTQPVSAHDAVKKYLNEHKEYFLVGLHQYKSDTQETITISKKPEITEKLSDFVKRLKVFLDVNIDIARTIIAQYLSCEFHGTPTTLQNLTMSHTSSTKLLRDIWLFQTSERMYYLKTLKLILEYHDDPEHPYHKEFAEFVDDASVEVLWKSLTSQLKLLISVNINLCEDMNLEMQGLWIKRNLQEQLELLECILLTHSMSSIKPEDFITLLELFSCHRFGVQPIYLAKLNLVPKRLQVRLTLCEISLLLCILDHQVILKQPELWESGIKKDIDIWITRLNNEYESEVAPIVLSWALVRCNHKYQPSDELISGTVNQLHVILSDRLFKDDSKTSKLVHLSVFNLLQLLSNQEIIPKSVERYYECLSITLKDPEIAKIYFEEQEQEDANIPQEKWLFPSDFTGYSTIASGLATSFPNKILKESYELPVTTIPISPEFQNIITNQNGVWYLNQDFHLFGLQEFRIPAGSFVHLEPQENPTHFVIQSRINYWSVFQHTLACCINSVKMGELPPFRIVKSGYRFWLQILRNVKELNADLKKPIGPTLDLMSEMLLKRMTDTEFFALVLESLTEVYNIQGAQYICDALRQMNFFPVLVDSYLPLEELIKPGNFIQGRIFELILDYDLVHNRYDLLLAYFKFLRIRFQKKSSDYDTFEIPGIIFILQDILPKFFDWVIEIGTPEQEMLFECITLLFDILREPLDESKPNYKLFQILQQIVIFDLLHITNGKVVLHIVARGNQHLEMLMQSETNWLSGPVIQYLYIVQMCLTILMLLFQKKSIVANSEEDMPLEALMFTQPKDEDTLKIIRNIASYMDHIFNKQLPVLACRILRKFAMKLQISLHGCFDMDSNQIRYVFIHRLRSKMESSDLKIAILDFVIACVQRQPGLTQTFFAKPTYLGDLEGDESLLGLMEEFLVSMSSETEFLNDPTLRSMMSLFHELWKTQKQVIVSVIRNNDKFWEKLCSPLKFRIMTNLVKSYSQILNIISLEVYVTPKKTLDQHLKQFLTDLLNPNEKYFPNWLSYIFEDNIANRNEKLEISLDLDADVPNFLSLLQSWKDFICVIMHRYPELLIPEAISKLGNSCLKALVFELTLMKDSRIVGILSGFFVIILAKYKQISDPESMDSLSQLVMLTHQFHKYWDRRIRLSILSSSVSIIRLLKNQLRENPDISIKIFNPVCQITCEELDQIHLKAKTSNEESILKINLLMELLDLCQDNPDLNRYCVHMKLCLRLVESLGTIVQIKSERPVSLAILDCLIRLVQTNFGEEFLNCDFSLQLWVKFLPPKEMLKRYGFDQDLWKSEEWWPLYQRVLSIVSLSLRRLKSRFLEDALSFVVIHDSYLVECILLLRQSIDLNALDMVEATVTFIYEIMKYQREWKPYHTESFVQIMKALQGSLYCCIAILLRPTYIKYTIDKNKPNFDDSSVLSTKVIDIINKLTSIVTKIAQVFLKQTPSLMSLLCNHCANMKPYNIILELEFNIPKLSNEDDCELSFGTIMHGISLFARALLHIHNKESKKCGPTERSPRKRLGPSQSESKLTPEEINPTSPSMNLTSSTWLQYFDKEKSTKSLESLSTLLATQTLIYLHEEPRQNRQYICREMNVHSELSIFHEYVKSISRSFTSSRCFEDYVGIVRTKHGATPIKVEETTFPRDLKSKVNEFTLECVSKEEDELRMKIVGGLKPPCEDDGDLLEVLSKVNFKFPDYFIFLSNLFTSICKSEDV